MLTDKEIDEIRKECKTMTNEQLTEYVIRYMLMVEAYKTILSTRKDDNNESSN